MIRKLTTVLVSMVVAAAFSSFLIANAKAVSAPTVNIVSLDVQPSIPPVLERIAFCESGDRQFNQDGSVVVGPTHDRGRFQINPIHEHEATKLGYDIDTLRGNTGFALELYRRNGTADWRSSKHCWGPDR